MYSYFQYLKFVTNIWPDGPVVSINKLYIVNKLYSNQMHKFRVSVQYYHYVGDLLNT